MKRLALLGASGHGKVVAEVAMLSGWSEVVFFDDAWPQCLRVGVWSVLGTTAQLMADLKQFDGVFVAIGDCKTRLQKLRILASAGADLPTLVHPHAVVSRHAKLGAGTVVMAGAVINADADIGMACIVNTGSTVDHDCHLADGVHISPGANLAGAVKVDSCSWVGIGAVVRQGQIIGPHVIVGAGSVVVSDVPSGQTVVGNPARPYSCDRHRVGAGR